MILLAHLSESGVIVYTYTIQRTDWVYVCKLDA